MTERAAGGWRAVAYWIREFLGEHEYARYVAAWRARHAGGPVPGGQHRMLTEREFFARRLEEKYRGASGCC